MTTPTLDHARRTTNSYTFAELLQILFEQQLTGQIVVHFRGGIPQAVDVGRPLQVILRTPANEST